MTTASIQNRFELVRQLFLTLYRLGAVDINAHIWANDINMFLINRRNHGEYI